MPYTLLFLDSLGGGEILLIMVFILLFFGSKKIPDLAKGLGKGMRELKDAIGGVQHDIERSVKEAEYNAYQAKKKEITPEEIKEEEKKQEEQ